MTMIDVVFGMIMCVGSSILIVSTIDKAGGLGRLTAGLAQINPGLTAAVGSGGFWPLFSLVFLTSVAPFGMPQLVQKFYAIKDERAIRRGMIFSTLFAALISVAAMKKGKHVYCQKPMTRTVHEARRIAEAARQARVATQVAVGNQASEATRLLCEWVWAGAIGPVRQVSNWSSRARTSSSPAPSRKRFSWATWPCAPGRNWSGTRTT
jgi:Na+(H+)/acetate symporter ActP